MPKATNATCIIIASKVHKHTVKQTILQLKNCPLICTSLWLPFFSQTEGRTQECTSLTIIILSTFIDHNNYTTIPLSISFFVFL